MTLKTRIIPTSQASAIQAALETLQRGALAAFPTDTVYGLGALVGDQRAIGQLYLVKGREASKAIAVLIGDMESLTRVAAELSERALRLARRFWPGPLTLVLPRHPDLPANLSPLPTVGVRMPNHPDALVLLRSAGPLAVTSANLSGKSNALTAQEVYTQLKGRIPLILDGGKTPGGLPSTVVDCTSPELTILRHGPITQDELIRAAA